MKAEWVVDVADLVGHCEVPVRYDVSKSIIDHELELGPELDLNVRSKRLGADSLAFDLLAPRCFRPYELPEDLNLAAGAEVQEVN